MSRNIRIKIAVTPVDYITDLILLVGTTICAWVWMLAFSASGIAPQRGYASFVLFIGACSLAARFSHVLKFSWRRLTTDDSDTGAQEHWDVNCTWRLWRWTFTYRSRDAVQ